MLKLIIVIIVNKAYVVVVKEAAPVIAPFLQYFLTPSIQNRSSPK